MASSFGIRKNVRILITFILSFALIITSIAWTPSNAFAAEPEYGYTVEPPQSLDFSFIDTTGKSYTNKSFLGQEVVIVIGALDCGNTRATMRNLDQLRNSGTKFKEVDLLVREIEYETDVTLSSYISSHPNNVVSNKYDENGGLFWAFDEFFGLNNNIMPEVIVLNKKGEVAYISFGPYAINGAVEGVELLQNNQGSSGTPTNPSNPGNQGGNQSVDYGKNAVYRVSGNVLYDEAFKVLDIINEERTKLGLTKLVMDENLLKLANLRAAETSFYFSHTRPNEGRGLELIQSGYTFGENIAMGQRSASDVMNSWMNSEGHRANILNGRFRAVGIGAYEVNGYKYWVQLFSDAITATASNRSAKKEEHAVESTASYATPLFETDSFTVSRSESVKLKTNVKTRETTLNEVNNNSYTWSSSDTKVATVDDKGVVQTHSVGTAIITASNKNKESVKIKATINVIPWLRLQGKGRYDTMKAIVEEGFEKKGGTVIIATGAGFKDALAASGFAGLYDAPVILTDGKNLSTQAGELLTKLRPSRIYVAGGTAVVTNNVLSQIQAKTGVAPKRLAGSNSSETSAKLALEGRGRWKEQTAIIATNKSFKDALSAAPIAYAKGYPILLADNGKTLSDQVINALNSLGVKQVIIVGGVGAVSTGVEAQLRNNGIAIETRLWGANGVATSKAIAEWGLKNGLSADNMGVATSQNYPDALAGAALCGYKNSVLILADDKAMDNTSFPKLYKSKIQTAYVFGGTSAVGNKTWNALVASTK